MPDKLCQHLSLVGGGGRSHIQAKRFINKKCKLQIAVLDDYYITYPKVKFEGRLFAQILI